MDAPKPILLQILLGLMILIDGIGFILFIISLIPVIGTSFSIALSFPLDIIAVLSFGVFLILQVINDASFLSTSLEEIRSNARYEKSVKGRIEKLLGLIQEKISEFLMRTIVWRIVGGALTLMVEIIPILGDFSPTWSVTVIFIMNQRSVAMNEISKIIGETKLSAGAVVRGVRTQQGRTAIRSDFARTQQGVEKIGETGVKSRDKIRSTVRTPYKNTARLDRNQPDQDNVRAIAQKLRNNQKMQQKS